MDVDVSASFDQSGLSACPEGYALSGMWRGDCEELHCIETFHCCQVLTEMPTTSEVPESTDISGTTTAVADWLASFDSMGWSDVPEGMLITGLERSGSAGDGSHGLHHIEAATYVNSIYSEGCTDEDWWSTWDEGNTWVMCPAGSAMKGLYRNEGDEGRLYHIEQGR